MALPLGLVPVLETQTASGRVSAIVYAAAVAFMFGASAVYHRVTWSNRRRLWMRRVDHAGIYLLIAGSYTPVGLLVLDGAWRLAVLAIVWGGSATAILIKFCWVGAPKWMSATIGITLGWVGVAALPQVADRVGLTACILLVAGGLAYTLGGVVYALRRPDFVPSVFGYHEVFHALVILAVALQYTSIAVWVLPRG